MKRRFISKEKHKINNIVIVVLISISLTCIFNLLTGKEMIREYFLSSLLNESTNNNDSISSIAESLTRKENIVYSSLNRIVPKSNLSVFSGIIDDGWDYSKAKSDYVLDTNLKEEEDPEEPIVYIYNTHQVEEYESSLAEYSIKPNVMVASYIFKEKLKEQGISSIVEQKNVKEYLDEHGYTYEKSYRATEYFAHLAKEEHPSIYYLIDIHRDSAPLSVTYKEIEGKPYARVMLLTGYEHTPDDYNEGFTDRLNELLEENYPGISRGVLYRGPSTTYEIYDNIIVGKSTLIEIGGVDNKLEEINNTMEALAHVFSIYLNEEENEKEKKE